MTDPDGLSPRARRLRRAVAGTALLLGLATVTAAVAREVPDTTVPEVRVSQRAAERTTIERYPLRSALAQRRLVQTVARPPGPTTGRPLLVFLRGKGMDPTKIAGEPMRAALTALGDRAPLVLLPTDDGGSYWHDRQTGRWGSYVLREAIPEAIRRYGLDPDRVAIGGISMGGFGAYSLARRAPKRFCAIGGHSAALWTSPGAAAPGAFDDAADFKRNDPLRAVRAGRTRWTVPLWLDAGTADPFRGAQQDFRAALVARGMTVRASRWRGGHEPGYWNRHMAGYLRFYARALAGCGRNRDGS